MTLLSTAVLDNPKTRPKSAAPPDLVFVSMEDWDEVWRRNQLLCSVLARRHPEMKILFVGVARNVFRHLVSAEIGSLVANPTWSVLDFPNITVTKALRLAPNSYAWGRRLNNWLTRRHVMRLIRRLKMRNPVLWLNPHYGVHMAGRMGESKLVYDITDDWTLANFPSKDRKLIEKQDRELVKKADLVIVCSDVLRRSRAPFCKRLMLLPNGVDIEHYRGVLDDPGEQRLCFPRPILGYTGTLHPDRIDIDLVCALGKAFPGGSIVLVGPDHLSGADRARFSAMPNIHLLGIRRYQEIPKIMSSFDACIVPHRISKFTESLNPIKLWEYLASGKPIVSTEIAGFKEFRHLLEIARTPSEFVNGCHVALAETGDKGPAARRAAVRDHTWESRVDRLLETFSEIGAAREA